MVDNFLWVKDRISYIIRYKTTVDIVFRAYKYNEKMIPLYEYDTELLQKHKIYIMFFFKDTNILPTFEVLREVVPLENLINLLKEIVFITMNFLKRNRLKVVYNF